MLKQFFQSQKFWILVHSEEPIVRLRVVEVAVKYNKFIDKPILDKLKGDAMSAFL